MNNRGLNAILGMAVGGLLIKFGSQAKGRGSASADDYWYYDSS
jgi:hypothetical protein